MDIVQIPANIDAATYCQRNAAGNAFLALSGLTFLVATILVPLRTYIRLHIIKSFWWDDVCLVISYVSMNITIS